MLETGIIVCQSEKKIATSPHSSRHGVGTDTKLVHKATLLHRTDAREDLTRLSMNSPTKPNASMTHAYGQTLSKRASFKHVAGETFALDTDLFRIPKRLYLAPTRWNLLASSSLRPISSPVTKVSAQSVIFLRHKTSLTSDLRLASSTKYRTATPSARTWRFSADISSRCQRSIGKISCNKILSNPRQQY